MHRTNRVVCSLTIGCLLISFARADETAANAATSEIAERFHSDVLPILQRRCMSCHSHAADSMEGGLTLDWASGWKRGGSRGPAIVPGQANDSLLVKAIQHQDADLKMPEQRLPDEEISILIRWINDGAFDDRETQPASADPRDWWALRPLERPSIPDIGAAHPIDAFIRRRLQSEGIAPSPPADRSTLLRRLYLDIIGLVPTPEQMDAFVSDQDPAAWERTVDELLASPHYGERWARHWLDVIHFADSHGYEHDVGRDNAWRFRDYVIDSLNRDTPWDRFIREQLAADECFPEETQLIPALGFLGAGTFDLSTYSTGPVTFAYLDRDDMVTQTMAAFVSTTANCARCHAHKFDPISQPDYYALQAVFAGVLKGDRAYDADPTTAVERRRLQAVIAAADRRDAAELLTEANRPLLTRWLTSRGSGAEWQALSPDVFLSNEGATISRTQIGSSEALLVSGKSPETDIYSISASLPLTTLSAMKLEVLPHDSLPMQGPGRCQNGNLHLTEVLVSVFEPNSDSARPLTIAQASADFNQAGWGIERILDGNPKTAWGIYPEVAKPHHVVFQFAEPVAVTEGSRIAVTLKQLHGGSHLIGAFRLSVTDSPSSATTALPADVETALQVPESERSADQQLTLAAHVLKLAATTALGELPPQTLVYAAGTQVQIPGGNGQSSPGARPEPQLVHVLQRGDFDKPGAVAQPGALSVFSELEAHFNLPHPEREGSRRAALASWIADRDNVLTWRSIVNRIWQRHFEVGLCDTPSDFGRMGGLPSHPELLDWLAVWFRDDARGSLKKLHRLILTSQTWQQSSLHRDEPHQIDADNRLLWKQNSHRMDADQFRDAVLLASGAIDLTQHGPAVQHFLQSPGPQATPALNYADYDWSLPEARRRSIYRYVWRGIADPFMEALDFPDLGLLAPTRAFSASSLQALALYNNSFVLHFSQVMADRVSASAADVPTQVHTALRLVWCRSPHPAEALAFEQFVTDHGLPAFCRVLLNSNRFLFID
ncbi:MAG: PSD1 and planctomycete cytochrome C domain-containing protein [Planctomycetaceae bacterium]